MVQQALNLGVPLLPSVLLVVLLCVCCVIEVELLLCCFCCVVVASVSCVTVVVSGMSQFVLCQVFAVRAD